LPDRDEYAIESSGNNVNPKASNILTAKKAETDAEAARTGTIGFEDAALVERARKGDMQAFGSLIAKYQDRVFNAIYRMCGRREDAEELSQETFLRAIEKISQFRGQARFYTWVFRIAVNLVISHRRRDGRIKFQSLGGVEDPPGDRVVALKAAKRGDSPPEKVIAAETQRRVTEALEQLDDQMRVVLVLRDMEDMNYSEIAEVLSVPAGTVKSRLHRARCALAEKLEDLVE